LYFYGLGVEQDYDEAEAWYRRAADQGLAAGQFGLGLIYQDGYGVARDPAQAARWYELAAEQGFADAQYNLALMYEAGNGVTADKIEAYKWYSLAALGGIDIARDGRDQLASKMSAGEVAQAENQVKTWRAAHQ